MRGLFTDSYSLFSARPVAALAASLRGRLTPPAGWGGWFFWSLTEPFRGSVTDDGFRLTSYYARTQTTVRGTFVPLARGTRIDVQVSAIGAATWVVLALVGIPLLGLALLGAGLLVAGQALGLFLLAPLLVIGCFLFLATAASSAMSMSWARNRLEEWLADPPELARADALPAGTYRAARPRPRVGVLAALLVPAGLCFLLLTGLLIYWNEVSAERWTRTLTGCAEAVVPLADARLDAATEGQLVHVTGKTTPEGELTDRQFGLTAPVIRLERVVWLYQWHRKDTAGAGTQNWPADTVRTGRYVYVKEWAQELVGEPASYGKNGTGPWPAQCPNPKRKPFENRTVAAERVRLGDFLLAPELVGELRDAETLPVAAESVEKAPADGLRSPQQAADGSLYYGRDPAAPEVGDVRVEFRVVRPAEVSVIARQAGSRLEPYPSESGPMQLVQPGALSAEDMIAHARQSRAVVAWLVRPFLFGSLVVSLALIFAPLPWVAGDGAAGGGLLCLATWRVAALGAAAAYFLAYVGIHGIGEQPIMLAGLAVTGGILADLAYRGWGRARGAGEPAEKVLV